MITSSFQSIRSVAQSLFAFSPSPSDPKRAGEPSQTEDAPANLNTAQRSRPAPEDNYHPHAIPSRERKPRDKHLAYHDTRKYSDASSINTLGASPSGTMSKPRGPRSFKPRDTLSEPSRFTSSTGHHRSHPLQYGKQTRGKYDGLPLEAATGDNVMESRDVFEVADDQRIPNKKRKLDYQLTRLSRSSPVVDLTDDDPPTTEGPQSVVRVPLTNNNFFKSFTGPTPKPGGELFGLSEFKSVEERMKPTRFTSSQESHENGVTKDYSGSQNPTTQFRNSKSFPTTTGAHAESAPPHSRTQYDPPYQGSNADIEKNRPATKKPGEILRNAHDAQPLKTSQPKLSGNRHIDIGAFDPKGAKHRKFSRMSDITEIKESDDEAQPISSWNHKGFVGKRNNTQAKGSAGVGSDSFAHLPERTQEPDNGKSRVNLKNSKTKAHSQLQQKPRAGWELKLLVVPGDVLIGPGLRLAPNVSTGTYVVYTKDGPIPIGNGLLDIDPKKVNKLIHSDPCPTRFQIQGSTTAAEGKYQRNIEFAHEKDGEQFLHALREDSKNTLKPHPKLPEEMEKILAQDLPRHTQRHTVESDQEMALLEARQAQRQRQFSDRGHESHLHNHRNQRKLVSQLEVASDPSVPTTRTSRTLNMNESSKSNGTKAFSNLGSRSTRSSNRSENMAVNPEQHDDHEQYVDHDQRPPELVKYSEKYGFGSRWTHPVVYPPIGRRRETVHWEDLLRLDDGEFLNDSVIAFYMTWAAIQAENLGLPKEKVYYFSTYFYTTLTQGSRKGINYAAVQRWTAKFNLFSYDYVVIPVNEESHWYLAIVCNMSNINKMSQQRADQGRQEEDSEDLAVQVKKVLKSEDTSNTPEQKATEPMDLDIPSPPNAGDDILSTNHTAIDNEKQVNFEKQSNDSDARGHSAPTNVEKPQGDDDDSSINVAMVSQPAKSSPTSKKGKRKRPIPPGRTYALDEPVIVILDSLGLPHTKTARNLKNYLVEEGKSKHGLSFGVENIKAMFPSRSIPQQSNFCDCGVFLLGYFKKFLEDPDNFIQKILTKEMSVEADWPDMDPSKLRVDIIELLKGIEKEQAHQRREDKKRRLAEKEGKQPKSSSQEPEKLQVDHRQPTPLSEDSPGIRMKRPAKRESVEAEEPKKTMSLVEINEKDKRTDDDEMLLDPSPQDELPVEIPDSQPQDSQPQAEHDAHRATDAWREEEQRQEKLRGTSPPKKHQKPPEVLEIKESQ